MAPPSKKHKLNQELIKAAENAGKEYSTNPHTEKARAARKKRLSEDAELENAKNADNKAKSKKWQRMQNLASVKNALALVHGKAKMDLESELRNQCNNATIHARLQSGCHVSNKMSKLKRPSRRDSKLYIAQTRIFTLQEDMMPPQEVVMSAKVMVQIEDDGSLTESLINVDAEPSTSEMTLEDANHTSEQRRAEQDLFDHTVKWRSCQAFWTLALISAYNKMEALRNQPFSTFVENMSTGGFKRYAYWLNSNLAGDLAEHQGKYKRSQRLEWVKMAWKAAIEADATKAAIYHWTGVPVPPFQLLFTLPERIVMGLIFQVQAADIGLRSCGILLSSPDAHFGLGGPYEDDTLARKHRSFPRGQYSADDAFHLLSQLGNNTNDIPKDIVPWLELIDVGKDEELDENLLDADERAYIVPRYDEIEDRDEDSGDGDNGQADAPLFLESLYAIDGEVTDEDEHDHQGLFRQSLMMRVKSGSEFSFARLIDEY